VSGTGGWRFIWRVLRGGRSSFWKKKQKLLIITGKRCRTARTNKQKFLLLFSKEALSCCGRVSLNGAR
jgi:hypothetical protein